MYRPATLHDEINNATIHCHCIALITLTSLFRCTKCNLVSKFFVRLNRTMFKRTFISLCFQKHDDARLDEWPLQHTTPPPSRLYIQTHAICVYIYLHDAADSFHTLYLTDPRTLTQWVIRGLAVAEEPRVSGKVHWTGGHWLPFNVQW